MSDDPTVITGPSLRCLIQNAHRLLRHRFRRSPLWSLVSQLTGHGSGVSRRICQSVNLDPDQDAGAKTLKDFQPPENNPLTPPPASATVTSS